MKGVFIAANGRIFDATSCSRDPSTGMFINNQLLKSEISKPAPSVLKNNAPQESSTVVISDEEEEEEALRPPDIGLTNMTLADAVKNQSPQYKEFQRINKKIVMRPRKSSVEKKVRS